ncbi:MAG TPA: lysylphosphatidylglycerol synthase transmembrane domain-containing protein [archaeon]|nr:lysylphosphatidylglycerol synthase transmembrane domain-containing protein [archaeon]
MKKGIRTLLLGIGILIFLVMLSRANIADVGTAMSAAGIYIIPLSLIIIFEILLKSFRLKLLMGNRFKIQLGKLFRIVLETTFISVYTPGRMGEVVKLQLLKEFHGMERRYTLSYLVIERLLDLAVIVTLSAGVLFHLGLMQNLAYFILAIFILAALAWIAYRRFEKLRNAVGSTIKNIRETTLSLQLLFAAALTPAIWLIEVLVPFMLISVLGGEISFFTLASIYFASSLIGLISLIPGGVGTMDLSFYFLLSSIGGIDYGLALIVAAITRMVNLLVALLGFHLYMKDIRKPHLDEKS